MTVGVCQRTAVLLARPRMLEIARSSRTLHSGRGWTCQMTRSAPREDRHSALGESDRPPWSDWGDRHGRPVPGRRRSGPRRGRPRQPSSAVRAEYGGPAQFDRWTARSRVTIDDRLLCASRARSARGGCSSSSGLELSESHLESAARLAANPRVLMVYRAMLRGTSAR